MASKEAQPNTPLVDKGLDTWQRWNKLTLTAEGVAIAGGLVFGVPWLLALGATGAAIDGVQIVAIREVQKKRGQGRSVKMEKGKWYSLKKNNNLRKTPVLAGSRGSQPYNALPLVG